jgi:hypothetical protein
MASCLIVVDCPECDSGWRLVQAEDDERIVRGLSRTRTATSTNGDKSMQPAGQAHQMDQKPAIGFYGREVLPKLGLPI